MSNNERYKKYGMNNYNYPQYSVPSGIIMPQGYGVADFTPRNVYINGIPQPVIIRQPVVGLVYNPFTGLYEYRVIG